MKKLLLFLLAVVASLILAQAQSGQLKGIVKDGAGQPIPFANVAVYRGPQLITGSVCNIDGEYIVEPLRIGVYDIEISAVGYIKRQYAQITVDTGKATLLNGSLEPGKIIACPMTYDNCVPVIDISQGAQGTFWRAYDVVRNPSR